MTYFIKVGITILLLIAITVFAIMTDKLITLLKIHLPAKLVFFSFALLFL
ncbi:hypothetical protein [Bacillus alkalisoli]|nr:hypothetical protein [Bacillus alkalisoli]